MLEISLSLAIPAFIAGLLMFLAPCTLPLVPAYLAFISGVTQRELASTATKERARRQIMVSGVFFVLGFSVVFISFGMLAGFFGAQVGQFRGLLTHIGGVFIIIFGLMMLNLIRLTPFLREYRLQAPAIFKPGNPLSAFVIGATFALGWTPCVGPVLASVLLLASSEATVLSGGALLAVFSVGLSIPFLLTAFLYARATYTIAKVQSIANYISVVGGVFLICIGILLLTDNFGLTTVYGYQLFDWLGLSKLFEHF